VASRIHTTAFILTSRGSTRRDNFTVPGTAYDPFLDRLSWAQETAFLAPTLKA
jgi:hypothetical protein